jgi:hypothetical protein
MAEGKTEERGNPGLVTIFKFAIESFPYSPISQNKIGSKWVKRRKSVFHLAGMYDFAKVIA